MELITRSVYGAYLQTCQYLRLPFVMAANSTLNEKFNIQPGIAPDSNVYPAARYFAIGIGGHSYSVGAGGLTKPTSYQHQADDGGMFRQIPFVLRALANDIDSVERAKYGLRRIETHGGQQYAAYYLRRIDFSGISVGMEKVSVVNNVSNVTAFTPNNSNLNPTPTIIASDEVTTVSGNYVAATAKLTIGLTQDEIDEVLAAVTILHGDPAFAVISEIALVTGVDKTVSSPALGNTTITFNEVIAAQISATVNANWPLQYANQGVSMILDCGATEPLFALA